MGGGKSKLLTTTHHPLVNRRSPSEQISFPYPGNQGRPCSRNISQLKYARIFECKHTCLDEVTAALMEAGLESLNLIVGIDFTKSNEWTAKKSFGCKCLHHLGDSPNPYEQVVSIVGRTLSAFDENSLISCFGFGDVSTKDQEVFSFYSNTRPCNGFEEALLRYREIVPQLLFAGPTSFAPIIETAIGIVDKSGGQYHVLLIIADGQVTRSVETEHGQLSPHEQATVNAIVKASDYPLSIVLVGVGDGPWDTMKRFDDKIPSTAFGNFQFVNFTEIMSHNFSASKEAAFALAALKEIPLQYRTTLVTQPLRRTREASWKVPLPPPDWKYSFTNSSSNNSLLSEVQKNVASAPPENLIQNFEACPMCFTPCRDVIFGCGHQACYACGRRLLSCPICQAHIVTKVRLAV